MCESYAIAKPFLTKDLNIHRFWCSQSWNKSPTNEVKQPSDAGNSDIHNQTLC